MSLVLDEKEHHKLKQDLELKELEKKVVIPTDDNKVKSILRSLDHPITLFGELKGDRRARLRRIVAKSNQSDIEHIINDEDEDEEDEESILDDRKNQLFYTHGNEDLFNTRLNITKKSLKISDLRLNVQKYMYTNQNKDNKIKKLKLLDDFYSNVTKFQNISIQFGDNRPLSVIKYSPSNSLISIGSWNGTIKLWNISNNNQIANGEPLISDNHHNHLINYHTDRVCDIDWFDNDTNLDSLFASCSSDGTLFLHKSTNEDNSIYESINLIRHPQRIPKIKFHNHNSNILITSCYDGNWRMIDIEKNCVFLNQDGHSREVYALSLHPDGNLLTTAGKDGMALIWDLRIGRRVMALQGHAKQILSLDFHSNGFNLASGSEDNTIRIWDLRKIECTNMLAAHKNMVTQVKYLNNRTNTVLNNRYLKDIKNDKNINLNSWIPNQFNMDSDDMNIDNSYDNHNDLYSSYIKNSSVLISSSYDGACLIWNTNNNYTLLKSLIDHNNKIISSDISNDGTKIITACYDRTFRIASSLI